MTCTASTRDGSECRSAVSEWCESTYCLLHCKRDHGVMACEFKPNGGLGNESTPAAP